MARVHTQVTIQRGDVAQLNECPDRTFFIVYFDDSLRSQMTVDDDAWAEAEAFAKLLLDTVAQRRAQKALVAETA